MVHLASSQSNPERPESGFLLQPEQNRSSNQTQEQTANIREILEPSGVQKEVESVGPEQKSTEAVSGESQAQNVSGNDEQANPPAPVVDNEAINRQAEQMLNAGEGNRVDNARELTERVHDLFFSK